MSNPTTTAKPATYARLHDQSWGIRIQGAAPTPGATITVAKKSGETKTETVRAIVWSGADGYGQAIHLCSVVATQAPRVSWLDERQAADTSAACGTYAERLARAGSLT